MKAIYFKEINQFFSSLVGYVALGIFFLVLGLFLWVFPDTNILDFGYANIDGLFFLAPYIFMFLIPAITMRSFSEEMSSGTYELLATRPVTEMQIVLGKYFAAQTLVVLALVPTFIYAFTVYKLSIPAGNIDMGGIIGSYIGLFFLAATFSAVGVFSSSVSSNQIIAFLLGVAMCFLLYQSFDYLAKLGVFFGKSDFVVEQLGISAHYASISKGVIDTRDIIYFLSVIAVFLLLTRFVINSRKW